MLYSKVKKTLKENFNLEPRWLERVSVPNELFMTLIEGGFEEGHCFVMGDFIIYKKVCGKWLVFEGEEEAEDIDLEKLLSTGSISRAFLPFKGSYDEKSIQSLIGGQNKDKEDLINLLNSLEEGEKSLELTKYLINMDSECLKELNLAINNMGNNSSAKEVIKQSLVEVNKIKVSKLLNNIDTSAFYVLKTKQGKHGGFNIGYVSLCDFKDSSIKYGVYFYSLCDESFQETKKLIEDKLITFDNEADLDELFNLSLDESQLFYLCLLFKKEQTRLLHLLNEGILEDMIDEGFGPEYIYNSRNSA